MRLIKILDKVKENRSLYLLLYFMLLVIPALFINLGLMPFILDEGTRGTVSLEMLYSGNYMVPTINGELYYNKPPLFNWIQVLFVKLTANNSEFVMRLPVVLSLLLFSFTIYQTQKKEGGKAVALFSAIAFLTCGRILFYDSFRGLIDISFSWVIYLMFWFIYIYGKRDQYTLLFMLSYLMAALAFMMKGLPALVFLGISLLVYFLYTRRFKMLFSLEHLAGFTVLLAIVGSYLLVYSRYNSLDVYFETLWSESSKRTFMETSLWKSIRHLFIFPLDFIYHFLPWTLLIFVFFIKGSIKKIRENEFAVFAVFIFLSNILVYWFSPAIYPRYLFMFLPLFFYAIFWVYVNSNKKDLIRKIFSPLVFLMIFAILILIILIPFLARQELYDLFYVKYFIILILSAILVFFIFTGGKERILLLGSMLLIARIAFNWFVFPDRIEEGTELRQKNGAIVAGELTRGAPLYLFENTRIHHASTYYITRTREDILERWSGPPLPSHYYIVEKEDLESFPPHDVIHGFETRIESLRLYLVKTE
jgi:4-amino-4-deoxy-L-arabinose transferase-like glycosyltransferase